MISPIKYDVLIKRLPQTDYATVWLAMQSFTQQRNQDTLDEIWLVEHPPVFTLGQNSKPEHLLNPGDIPIIKTDRGGQVTYHGPGQLVAYTLLDIKRKGLSIRQLVTQLEQALMDVLAEYGITAYAKRDAPGVYVRDAKIGSIGLRIRKGCSYHGISFNVAMDLAPFKQINPCGYRGLAITQLSDLINNKDLDKDIVLAQLVQQLLYHLNYQQPFLDL